MTPDLSATVAKIATVAADANQLESQANQDAIAVSAVTGGYEIEVTDVASYDDPENPGTPVEATNVSGLFDFTVDTVDGEWVGLTITFDEDLTNVKVNGTALTQADIDAATALGYTGGKTYIYFVNYSNLAGAGVTIALSTVDDSKNAINVTLTQGE